MESDSDGPHAPRPAAKDPGDGQLDGPFAGNDCDLIEDIPSSGDNSDERPNHNENRNENMSTGKPIARNPQGALLSCGNISCTS